MMFTSPNASGKPSLDFQTQEFISALAHRPELMNLEYLQHFIGRPVNERSQRAMPDKQYHWYGPEGALRYELTQTEHPREQMTESRMTMHLPNSTVTLEDVERLYGKTAQRFYEYGAHATLLYSFVPNTQLVFVVPRTTFRVGQVKVNYRGPTLPPPSTADIAQGRDQFKARMLEMVDQGNWGQAVPWLLTRLKENPYDGDAHYQLGRAYARQGHLHEAIVQYKAALALASPVSGGNSAGGVSSSAINGSQEQSSAGGDLRKKCIAGLRELKVVVQPEEQYEKDRAYRKKLRIFQKGQRIRARGKEKVRKQKEGQDIPAGTQQQLPPEPTVSR